MAVVVHESFPYKGKTITRGTVLTGAEAEEIKSKPAFRRFYNIVHDAHFAPAEVAPEAAATNTGFAPPTAAAPAKPAAPASTTVKE